MKKILLSLLTICAFVIVKGQSQICGAAAVKRWTNERVDINDPQSALLPGSQASITAPITIDGSTEDWAAVITGPFKYFNQPVPTYQPSPHEEPIADAIGNIQLDALKGEAGERDRPGQEHRDLRYFAFTYDRKNAYFYFRRPGNNSAQVTLYYFIDINVDGFMRTGEPVIKIVYNGGQGTLSMAYFVEDPGSILGSQAIAGSWVNGKGNAMSATVNRIGSNNTSDWVVGSADGWSMPGSIVDVPNSDLPLVDIPGGEKVGGMGLKDTYSYGATSTGYGAEFVIPWNFFRLYGGPYAYAAAYPTLTYQSIFTWHVSLSGGNSGIEGAEDNAGGCCSGLAVSGEPVVSKAGSWDHLGDPYSYRLNTTYTNGKNLNTKVTTASIKVINPRDANGAPIPESVVENWTASGYRTGTCDGSDAQIEPIAYTYNGRFITPNGIDPSKDDTIFTFVSSDLSKSYVVISGTVGATACYFINVNALGWPPLASATVSYQFETAFDIQSITCGDLQNGSAEGSLSALPVKLISFNAARSGQNVNLTWQTSSEVNNTGFEVQRLTGSGDWQTVGFVTTKAVNGNSSSTLSYQYTDINTTKGITQYRLKQIDKDHRSAYSVIRSVRGVGQKSNTIIYPNPTRDGKVNVVFEDANSTRDVSLMDVSGKTLRQWKGVTNNNIQIDNLNAGFYTIRIMNIETGEQSVEKFIVNKR
jgi:hypothetical protein